MRHWTDLLRTLGSVHLLDYPYMTEGRKRPDPLPKLLAGHRAALDRLRQSHTGRIVLIGKSMGSRVGCHLALEQKVTALVCLGYPLCGGGDPTKLRDEVLRKLRTPILFVHGTRDPLCPLDRLAEVRRQMRAANELHVVEGGNHSLLVSKTQLKANGESQDDVDRRILEEFRAFIKKKPALPRGLTHRVRRFENPTPLTNFVGGNNTHKSARMRSPQKLPSPVVSSRA
jgi:predicted alpha/beta-hydrolase family hydrolase